MFHDVVLSKNVQKKGGTAPNLGIHAETDALRCSLPADLGILLSDRALGLGFHGPVFVGKEGPLRHISSSTVSSSSSPAHQR